MAHIPKKTYSRQNYSINDKGKENVDPFDELLSSPLKQEVNFQPISFWDKKAKHGRFTKKCKKLDCGLFETSDSDNSPCQRKRKPKVKFKQSKARTLQPKCTNLKLNVKRCYSSENSFIKKSEVCIPVVPNINRTFKSDEDFDVYRDLSPGSNLNYNKTVENDFISSCCKYTSNKFTCPKKNLHKSNHINSSDYKKICSLDSPIQLKCNQNEFLSDNTCSIPNSLNSKISDTNVLKEQLVSNLENSGNCTIQFPESEEKETLTPFLLGRDSFKFVTVKRRFNNPINGSMLNEDLSYSSTSVGCEETDMSLRQSWNKLNQIIALNNLKFEDDDTLMEILRFDDDESLICSDDASLIFALINDESFDETLYIKGVDDFVLESVKLQKVNLECGVPDESSSISDDTLSSFNDEDTVINVSHKPFTNVSVTKGPTPKCEDSSTVLQLTDGISELSLINATGFESSEFTAAKTMTFQQNEDKEDSFLVNLKNVTTKRRGFLCDKNEEEEACDKISVVVKEKQAETEPQFEESLWINDGNLDWNKTISFANPVFESTRVVHNTSRTKQLEKNFLEETLGGLDHTYALKPGKKWLRSVSVLKQLRNGNIAESKHESTRITGRKFESFVQDLLEIQNEKSEFFTTITDITAPNSILSDSYDKGVNHSVCKHTTNYLPEKFNDHNFSLTKSFSNETLLEITSLSHTVKVIQPETGSSDFRSALGLEKDESSKISARDFILNQCGQEDVLPFEEYFNEMTLKNCKKIGEGVYGEVFMYDDAVIKIIPIEGSDKVNGEPQKTFEEIISEVVIASKLSNLRRGEENRTHGFAEMKRCWCVKGKYPKYLVDLWDEYDKSGSGSENDSPIMFKTDQLYVILELTNGGRDLESFVFNSSIQTLSVFIQTAFSLAAAEKAFEFEHRDLHWGNILISDTKDKFMDVFLDGVQFKIPTKGVKVCIIDFTLSRINHEGCCIYNDLSVDPTLFVSEGDYQFEIYRMMLKEVQNDWSLFRPRTNIFWLHYLIDKMIKMVRYKNKKAKIHAKHLKDLKTLKSEILNYKDSLNLALSSFLSDVIHKI